MYFCTSRHGARCPHPKKCAKVILEISTKNDFEILVVKIKMTKSLSRLGSSISRIHVLTRSAPVFGVYDFCFASKAGSGVLHANAENRRVFKPACFRRLFLTSGEHLLQISFSHFSKCRSPRLPFLKMVTFLEYLV